MSQWIDWSGGGCPVDGLVIVEAELRSGEIGSWEASIWVWEHNSVKPSADIIKYRVVETMKSEPPAIIETDSPVPEHYSAGLITEAMVGQKIDPALIAEIYTMSGMRFTILKKTLRCGKGNKTYEQDLQDIISAANRELELVDVIGKERATPFDLTGITEEAMAGN